jgi:antitoxin (DNA-binding transcriptional repressor) of toxin-antitoxin stability system
VGFDFPDQVWGFEGLTILVEVTNPNAKPSKKTRERKERQRLFREKWRGGLAVEITTEAEVVALLTTLQPARRPIALLAECYRVTGADPDGAPDGMLASMALAEVTRLRQEADAAELRADAAEAELARLRGAK